MALIPEEIIARIIERSDIVETISTYIPLKRAGRNFKANCPFHHEKTPSFVVNPDKQIFHCFGCAVGGNVVSFIMKQEHLEFPEAIRFLAQKANITIPTDQVARSDNNIRQTIFQVNQLAVEYFQNNLLFGKDGKSKIAREYLKDRGVTPEAAKQFNIGFALDEWDGLLNHLKQKGITLGLMEKAGLIIARESKEGYYDRFRNRIIFPIFDTMGHCRAFGARAMDQSPAKYINSPETVVYTKGQHLYGFHLAKPSITKDDRVIIVEGYMDCLIPFQAGVSNIVASLGTALTVEQIRLLHRYTKNVVMLFDMDQAGESAMIRSLDILIEEDMSVKVARLSDGDDPDSYVRKYGVESFRERIEQSESLFEYKLRILTAKHDAKSIEGKAKISAEILPTINRMSSEVLKAGYVEALSRFLGIPQQALFAELRKVSTVNKEVKKDTVLKINTQIYRSVEHDMLKLLLQEESLIIETKNEVDIACFQDTKIRSVISRIYTLFDQGKKIDWESLIADCNDEDLQKILLSLMTEESDCVGDKKKIHRDYVARIKKDRLKTLRQELLDEIRQAESNGDHLKLNDLKIKFNQLVKH